MLDVLRRPGNAGPGIERLVAHSRGMRQLIALIRAVAPSDCSVLITGETGAGKECVARAIHALSRRAAGRLLAIHCAAIPPTLLEAELFGHERGAFTGAEARQKGAFEAAGGGTFLLDEIGELAPPLQVKLLRVLQEKEITRLGSTDPVPVDVRILATTNRNLRSEAEKGIFRADLFYRLNTVELHVPPLRERREDILALAGEFLAEAQDAGPLGCTPDGPRPRELSPAAATCLLHYDWPGNVRELCSVIERACLLSSGPRIEPRHLPPEVVQPTLQTPVSAGGSAEAWEREGVRAQEEPGQSPGPSRSHASTPPPAGFGARGRVMSPGPSRSHASTLSHFHAAAVAGDASSATPSDERGASPLLDFRAARRQFERDYFLRLLAQCHGNISAASRSAGLSWKHFRHKMYELDIRLGA